VWIADPLDGTVNFVHGYAPVAVSVGLWEDGRPLCGVVIDIERHEALLDLAVVKGHRLRLVVAGRLKLRAA
jgi:myo-inositol-1(or 4)-monophosphatase